MGTFLGLLALASPLLIPLYFVVTFLLALWLTRVIKSRHFYTVFLLLLLFFWLPGLWDVILGRAYFHYLCQTDGGVHIYETVELGDEYWNEDGSPTFYTEKGAFDGSVFEGKYKFVRNNHPKMGLGSTIKKRPRQIIETETDRVLGEWVLYEYLGGWVVHNLQPFMVGSTLCHSYDDTPVNPSSKGNGNETHQKFTSYIFLRKKR